MNRGTTHGSVNGPYLFSIFINDLEISIDILLLCTLCIFSRYLVSGIISFWVFNTT